MTCIVGIAEKGRVWIGGDSAGVAGLSLQVRADRKVFRNGPYLFGFTSSFRMGQLLRWKLQPPAPPARGLERFMATTFVDAVRDCLKAGGYAKKDDERESAGTFLVGVAGRLFAIQSDYQVSETVNRVQAVGCGDDLALGALYVTPHMAPRARIRRALEAAEAHSAGVQRPFCILSRAA